jgi:Asp-tRNA(Asn)/Glu-tRNA(Gln) amidotransferase A subunit family amidase
VGAARVDLLGISRAAPCQSIEQIRNPLCPGRTILGSNGALTALVAAGCASLGVGVDTGADLAVAAACSGLLAFRCSHGICAGDDSQHVLLPSLACSALTMVSSSASVLSKV